jgi:hypothetical protein
MLFILGVVMLVLGVAFCLLGDVKLPGGRVLKARYGQTCGVVMLCYFPVVFVLQRWLGDHADLTDYLTLVYCLVLVVCLGLCWLIVLKTTSPVRPVRKYSAPLPANNPLLQDEPLRDSVTPQQTFLNDAEGEPKPAPRAPAGNKNMFDFS